MTKFQCHSNTKFQFVAHKKHTPSLYTDESVHIVLKTIGAARENRMEEMQAVRG